MDLGSRNGTFLNGQRMKKQVELSYGDVIYIVGLKIVFLKNILAMSMPYENIKIHDLQIININETIQESDMSESFVRKGFVHIQEFVSRNNRKACWIRLPLAAIFSVAVFVDFDISDCSFRFLIFRLWCYYF